MSREARERMAEMFVASRDGYAAVKVDAHKLWPGGLPSYAQPERSPRTGDDLFADFGHLVRPRSDH